ncbi:MAG: hypothetical protein AAGF54_20345, partial [Pseudomonadota bacterium]
AKCTSSDNLFGRGGYGVCPGPPGLKAMAVVVRRFSNSPASGSPEAVCFFGSTTMGYYEQIGVENRRYREKRAAMHPLRRRVMDVLETVFFFTASLVLWVIMLSPIWLVFW